jgi:hypothetical protein
MRGWGGEVADRHVRFVYRNRPVARLWHVGEPVRAALAAAGAKAPGVRTSQG